VRLTNLLYIMDDEHNPKALGCAGHPLVKTPNLDRVAQRGVRFRYAYSSSPLCVPARGCIATGLPVHQNGCWDNAIAYDGRIPSWGHRLQENGHRSVSIGKLHYTNETDSTGFDEQHIPMHIFDGGDLHGSVRDELPVRYQSKNLAAHIGRGETEYSDYDRKIASLAQNWLTREAPKHGSKPWVLFVSFICPHYPLVAPPEYYDMYPVERIPLPKRRIDYGAPKHPWWQAFDGSYVFDRYFPSDHERRVAIAAYYGLCSFVDNNVGKLLKTLEDSGLAGNTRVIFTSDHGDNLGSRGMWGKSTMYEESAGIPMFLMGPDVPAGRTVQTPVTLVDLYPTILDCTGVAPNADDRKRPGRSMLRIAAEKDDPDRLVMSEYHGAGARTGSFMLRRGRFKYIHYVGYAPELYDLDTDPEELYDLGTRVEFASVVKEFEKTLRSMLDPEDVDRRAKRDQAALVARHGGREAVLSKGGVNHTPAPGNDPIYIAN